MYPESKKTRGECFNVETKLTQKLKNFVGVEHSQSRRISNYFSITSKINVFAIKGPADITVKLAGNNLIDGVPRLFRRIVSKRDERLIILNRFRLFFFFKLNVVYDQ